MEDNASNPLDDNINNEGIKIHVDKRTIPVFIAIFIVGLLIGVSLSAIIQRNKEQNEIDEDIEFIDSDEDGFSDLDEIEVYGTDPLNAYDIMMRTGLLIIYHSDNNQQFGRERDVSVLFSKNEKNVSEIFQISSYATSTRIVWGEFTLKNVETGWEIVNEDTSGYDHININISLDSTSSIVMNDLSVGYGVEDNIMWISFGEYPSFSTDVNLKGVQIDLEFIENMGFYFGLKMDEYIRFFEGIYDKEKDDFKFILVEEISYLDPLAVEGDIIHQSNPSSSLQLDYSWDEEFLGYSILLLKESTERNQIWALLIPEYWINNNMNSVIMFEQVVPITSENPFLDSIIYSDIPFVTPKMNLHYGIVTSPIIHVDYYIPSTISKFHTIIETKEMVPVTVECYILWTSIQDITDVISENGVGSDLLNSFCISLGLENAAIGLMMDLEMSDKITLDTISRSIGIAVSSRTDPDETRLMIGTIEGVLHKISGDHNINENVPLLVVDTFKQYDSIVETTIQVIDDSPSEYSFRNANKIMVELEGHIIGTTVKTLIDQLDDIEEFSFLKILQYFPHDICVYQLIQIDDSNLEVYSIPIIQVVSGKGKTFFGERMKVQGWFSDEMVDDSLSDIIEKSLINVELSDHLQKFMISILKQENNGRNLSMFLEGWFRDELHDSVTRMITDLENQTLSNIETMEINSFSIKEMVNYHFNKFEKTVDANLLSLGVKLNATMENITVGLSYILNSNNIIFDIQSELENILNNNLTFDDVTSFISDLESELAELDGLINDIETISNAHLSNLNNVTDQLLSINSSFSNLSNEISGLYKNIADQLKKTMENTILAIDIDKIVAKIMEPFGLFPPLPPPGFDSFQSYIEYIMEDIKISESEYFSYLSTNYTSFWDYVNKSSEFDFLDEISNLSKDIVKNITSAIEMLQTISNQYKINIEQKIQDLRNNFNEINGCVDNLRYLMEDFDTNRDLILKYVEDLDTSLNDMMINISELNINIIQEKELLNREIMNIDLMMDSLSIKIKDDLENEYIDFFQIFIDDMINCIKNNTVNSINQYADDILLLDEFFKELYSFYAKDVLSFIDTEIWDLITTKGRFQIEGYIIVHKMYF